MSAESERPGKDNVVCARSVASASVDGGDAMGEMWFSGACRRDPGPQKRHNLPKGVVMARLYILGQRFSLSSSDLVRSPTSFEN